MKILIDARLYGMENTGIGRYIVNLVSGLVKIDTKNSYQLLLNNKYFNELKLPNNWVKIKAEFKQYSWEEQIKLPLILHRLNPDLVHFPHFNVPLICPKPFIVTIHDMLMHKQKGKDATTLPVWEYQIKRLAYRIAFDRAVGGSKKILVPSETIKKELVSFYNLDPDKVSSTYEGVDLSEFEDSTESDVDKPYFLYVGNAYPHKNLIRAMEAVVQLNEESQLVIVAARSVFTDRLRMLVTKNGWQREIRILGFVSNAELKTLYQNSLGFLFPSLSEGFGLPGLEAMALGTVCVASDIPVFREIYLDKVLYFNPLDVGSIKTALQKVLSLTVEKRKTLIEEGKLFVKRYSWDKMAKQTLDIYESSLSL